MPRLRYYKDFEEIGEYEIPDNRPISSWFSTASIIAGLSESKIKAQIEYHRTQLQILQEELLGRKKGIRVIVQSDNKNPVIGIKREQGCKGTTKKFRKFLTAIGNGKVSAAVLLNYLKELENGSSNSNQVS